MIVLGKFVCFFQNYLEVCSFFSSRISYLNNWDKKIPNLDVADDYRSEREEIHSVQGKEFPFSFGDVSKYRFYFKKIRIYFLKYVVKVLMGAVDDWFDTLDERRVTGNAPPSRHRNRDKKKSGCCIS